MKTIFIVIVTFIAKYIVTFLWTLIVMAETPLSYIGFYLTFKYVFNETKTIPCVSN